MSTATARKRPAKAAGKPVEWPADKVERIAVALLLPYARNARTHSDEQIEQLAASIREWGFTMPVLVDESYEIIAGHGRVMAAARIGLKEVPVMTARGWTQRQIKAYRLADNQLALNSAWDVKLLAAELGELKGVEGLAGFTVEQLADLFKTEQPPDEFPESDENIDTEHTCPRCGFRWSGESTASAEDEEA